MRRASGVANASKMLAKLGESSRAIGETDTTDTTDTNDTNDTNASKSVRGSHEILREDSNSRPSTTKHKDFF